MNEKSPITPEDYREPRCLLDGKPYGASPVRPVPQQRIVEKLDEYMERRDWAGAERHLLYWLEEAIQGGDDRGRLLICNELVGHYRKTGSRENALARAEEALALVDRLELGGSLSAGTTCVNAATACSAFGEDERALDLFGKAREIFETRADTGPELLGGLYNNMALTLAALGRYDEAHVLFDRAMEAMGRVPGGELEQAVTCLNRADALEAELGAAEAEARIRPLLDRALQLLRTSSAPRDGYYAFVCDKCAPGFGHHGYAAAASELSAAAEAIYDRA